jgi:hypothetical protein
MPHRLQITIDDAQYERLRAQSRRTGASLAELIRRAIDEAGYELDHAERISLLEESFGGWAGREAPDRVPSGTAYVADLRRQTPA